MLILLVGGIWSLFIIGVDPEEGTDWEWGSNRDWLDSLVSSVRSGFTWCCGICWMWYLTGFSRWDWTWKEGEKFLKCYFFFVSLIYKFLIWKFDSSYISTWNLYPLNVSTSRSLLLLLASELFMLHSQTNKKMLVFQAIFFYSLNFQFFSHYSFHYWWE